MTNTDSNSPNEKQNTKEFVLEKTSKPLDEDMFWKIVDTSVKTSKTQDEQESFVIKELEKLDPHEIIGFKLRTNKLLDDVYTSEMWCAGYIINGHCTDDGFEDFRHWIISRGKDAYYSAKENPDNLLQAIDNEDHICTFEKFWYVALTAFQNKTSKDLYNYIDWDAIASEWGYTEVEFNWDGEEPDSMRAICPKLFEKFWE